jgi:hypothetical protein
MKVKGPLLDRYQAGVASNLDDRPRAALGQWHHGAVRPLDQLLDNGGMQDSLGAAGLLDRIAELCDCGREIAISEALHFHLGGSRD